MLDQVKPETTRMTLPENDLLAEVSLKNIEPKELLTVVHSLYQGKLVRQTAVLTTNYTAEISEHPGTSIQLAVVAEF